MSAHSGRRCVSNRIVEVFQREPSQHFLPASTMFPKLITSSKLFPVVSRAFASRFAFRRW